MSPGKEQHEKELQTVKERYEEKVNGLNGMLQMHQKIKVELEEKLE